MAPDLFDDRSAGHYPNLDPDSAQIRLIVLARGALESPIHCTYRVVSLDDQDLSYETLSYVWKDAAGTEPIWVGGEAASVTRSLFGALEQLRQVDCDRTLWIDAICINQGDSAEKTLLLAGLYVDRIAVVEEWSQGQPGRSQEIVMGRAGRWGDLITRFQRSAADTWHAAELPGDWMQALLGVITGRLVPGDPGDGEPYLDGWSKDMLRDQALFMTQGGRFGLGPLNAQPGQQLWIVGGCRLPVILDMWPGDSNGEDGDKASCRDFTWVSECFVYGMMKGEAVEGRGDEQVDIRLH